MARHDHYVSDDHSDNDEPRVRIDALIAPGLRRAFPLPAEGHAHDDRFRLLLDVFAQRRGGTS